MCSMWNNAILFQNSKLIKKIVNLTDLKFQKDELDVLDAI